MSQIRHSPQKSHRIRSSPEEDEGNHYFASMKKLKSLRPEFLVDDAKTRVGDIPEANVHELNEPCTPYRCSCERNGGVSSSCDPQENSVSHTATLTGPGNATTTGGTAGQGSSHGGFAQSSPVGGWIYYNEHGQIDGPYRQEQLNCGLSLRLLPEDLLVYPIGSAVQLKHLKHVPGHSAWSERFPTTESAATTADLRGSLVGSSKEDTTPMFTESTCENENQ